MRFKAIKCDICGKFINKDMGHYKFKQRNYHFICDVIGVAEKKQVWTKLDMCGDCYQDLESFVAGNNQLRKDGQQPILIVDDKE